jgi:Zn-dependent peptidase ImmA (M78 family)/DNA-binding XRE family transcriptional regulator
MVARERRGLSRAGLAELARISERSIRKYEAGEDVPLPSTQAELAEVLQVPVSFFYGPPLEGLGESAATFRAASKLPMYRRRAALAAGSFAMHVAEYVAERFVLPKVDVPDLAGLEPELAAEAVRAAWGQGFGPIPNVVRLLESRGVMVFALAEDCRELDAFAWWREGRPFVMLNTLKSAEHGRFDAAHELGHLVLHRHLSATAREHEEEAHQFAAAFLLPKQGVVASAPRGANLADVLYHKKRWGVSAMAFTRRLLQLRFLSPHQYRSLVIELSKRGYRTSEPGGTERETSHLMTLLLSELRSEGVTMPRLADELTMSVDDVRDLMMGLATVAV